MTNTSQKTHFHVEERNLSGANANQLRFQMKTPGNIYGLNQESQAIQMPKNDFLRLYAEEGDTGLIYLAVGDSKKEVPVLIDDVNYHPVTGVVQHVVFRRVNLKVVLKADVPVELTGENKIPDTNVLLVTDSIEVEALPSDIPEAFVIDIEKLTEVGQAITYVELEYDRSKVTIVFAGEETDESPVALLQEVKEEVVEVEPSESPEGEGQDNTAAKGDTPAAETNEDS